MLTSFGRVHSVVREMCSVTSLPRTISAVLGASCAGCDVSSISLPPLDVLAEAMFRGFPGKGRKAESRFAIAGGLMIYDWTAR